MSKVEKLIEKFKSSPIDFTWDELVKVLNYLGYFEKTTKGKTGGSRVKFVNNETDVINLHKPHPSNIVKQYVIKQIIEKLDL
jgi:predicted RNA binding protein YcfA (HicA-like mRNA interferase family)